MIPLALIMDGDGAFPEATSLGAVTAIARLSLGCQSGASSVCIEITSADGKKYYGQTTLNLLNQAVRAFNIREEMEKGAGGGKVQ
jgi:hypothetical protein